LELGLGAKSSGGRTWSLLYLALASSQRGRTQRVDYGGRNARPAQGMLSGCCQWSPGELAPARSETALNLIRSLGSLVPGASFSAVWESGRPAASRRESQWVEVEECEPCLSLPPFLFEGGDLLHRHRPRDARLAPLLLLLMLTRAWGPSVAWLDGSAGGTFSSVCLRSGPVGSFARCQATPTTLSFLQSHTDLCSPCSRLSQRCWRARR
jgi:hypothetical protein